MGWLLVSFIFGILSIANTTISNIKSSIISWRFLHSVTLFEKFFKLCEHLQVLGVTRYASSYSLGWKEVCLKTHLRFYYQLCVYMGALLKEKAVSKHLFCTFIPLPLAMTLGPQLWEPLSYTIYPMQGCGRAGAYLQQSTGESRTTKESLFYSLQWILSTYLNQTFWSSKSKVLKYNHSKVNWLSKSVDQWHRKWF